MIGYIEGNILQKNDDRILILANQIGYEVLLPTIVMDSLKERKVGDTVSLFIYFHQTEKQPKPVLIGFNTDEEKEFFQRLITVEDIGPMKAAKALTLPVHDIASAVEANDLDKLQKLKGIGKRTAQKMIASLAGKLDKFVLSKIETGRPTVKQDELIQPVLDILVEQLGIKPVDAKRRVIETLTLNPSIITPEALLEEVFRAKL
ncbi:MAG: Holliday junction branch migration protein RuvA [Deltaproteobacteria bacterium]